MRLSLESKKMLPSFNSIYKLFERKSEIFFT